MIIACIRPRSLSMSELGAGLKKHRRHKQEACNIKQGGSSQAALCTPLI